MTVWIWTNISETTAMTTTGATSIPAASGSAAPRQVRPLPAVWFGGNMPAARLGLIVSLLVPLSLLLWDAHAHRLGVNAVNFAIHTTGGVAVVCLLLSLAVTPLRNITGFNWLVQFRRSLGVYAFYYAAVHLTIYFWWDRQHSLSSTAYEITHRYYLMIGFVSLSLMAPLWATSFNAAIRKMGGKWWKRLHRLVYLAAALACYHFYLQTKADKRLPDIAIGVLAGLLLWRIVIAVIHRVRAPAKAKAAPAAGGKVGFWKGDLRIIGLFRETDSVRTFRLAPVDGTPIPFSFRAGQFLTLLPEIDGKKVGRSYTIASPPTRDAYVELTIKREDNGKVSNFLHDMMMTGGAVTVSAPAGRFTFDPSKEPGILLIAGGVGITPVMSILRDLTDRCWDGKIDLVFSVRSTSDVIFDAELRLLPDAARAVSLVDEFQEVLNIELVLGKPARADGARTTGFARFAGPLFLKVEVIRGDMEKAARRDLRDFAGHLLHLGRCAFRITSAAVRRASKMLDKPGVVKLGSLVPIDHAEAILSRHSSQRVAVVGVPANAARLRERELRYPTCGMTAHMLLAIGDDTGVARRGIVVQEAVEMSCMRRFGEKRPDPENIQTPALQGFVFIGVTRFELATSWSRTKRSTKLSYTP
jgi:ferredoxin-NADP reductase/DMSO/TMAO reductase YedYZ heme-binding membrane subunit